MSRPWLFLALAACGKDAPPPAPKIVAAPEPVAPSAFTCSSLLSLEDAARLLGGAAQQTDTQMAHPDGVPAPCAYAIASPGGREAWSWDLDCRPKMKDTFDALLEQYGRASLDNVLAYAQISDAGAPVDPDARPLGPPPTRASEVAVGARALDYMGQGLIFLDDDAPCYARVMGPDPVRRKALAQHLAQVLTPATAPTALR